MALFTLHDLEKRVQERAKASAEVSYTRKLIDRGVSHCAKKLGEEAVEAALAAVGEDRDHMIAEAADVLYHLLVLLHARGISLAEVEAEQGRGPRREGGTQGRLKGREWSNARSRMFCPIACSPAPSGRRCARIRR